MKLEIEFDSTPSLKESARKTIIDPNAPAGEQVKEVEKKVKKVKAVKLPRIKVEKERTSLLAPKEHLELLRDVVAIDSSVNMNDHLCRAVLEYINSRQWSAESVSRRPADFVMKKGRKKVEETVETVTEVPVA